MAESETETQHKQAFMKRVKAARIARNLKQWEMAEAMGMPQDKYKQYETRSYLPPHLYNRFCLVCRIEVVWLVTGHGKMAPKPAPEPRQEPTAAPARKVRAKRVA